MVHKVRTYISYRTLFHPIPILAFLLLFVFIRIALASLELEGVYKCSLFNGLCTRLGPKLLGSSGDLESLVKDFYNFFNQVKTEQVVVDRKIPDNFTQLVSELNSNTYSAKYFVIILKGMMERSEREIRKSKLQDLMNKHLAASSVPKGIHCLSLRLTDDYSSDTHARRLLRSPELLPLLSDKLILLFYSFK